MGSGGRRRSGRLRGRGALERLCFDNLLDSAEERVYFKDRAGRFLLVSRGFVDAHAPGCSAGDLVGKTDFDVFSEPHAAAAFEDEQRVMATGEPLVGLIERETFRDRPDAWVATIKQPLRDRKGRVIGTFGISRDVTAQVEAERQLVDQALHDGLTGLANRVALMDRLGHALVAVERRPGRIALFFVDLDDFKVINDSFGHENGDQMLVEVARRLSGVARRTDTVARLGGDEFVVLCADLRPDEDPEVVGDRLVRSLSQPFSLGGHDHVVTASVGVAVTSDPAAEPSQLLQEADVAMYRAKDLGGDRFEVFTPSQRVAVLADQALDLELRRAVSGSELRLVYQPVFALADHSLRGLEALVRWHHPTRGVLAPGEFVPLAEQRGLVARIDDFALDAACRQLALWQGEPGWPLGCSVAVNVSGRRLADPCYPGHVAAVVARHGVDPRRLCLEITETALAGGTTEVEQVVARLSAVGVRLALDDFGTGYSALAHLQHLEVDVLKIDRSFVEHIGRSERDREIVAALTAMSHALGMTVVGEGIEHVHQLAELTALGCDEGQGFLLSRPMEPELVLDLVQATTDRRSRALVRGLKSALSG